MDRIEPQTGSGLPAVDIMNRTVRGTPKCLTCAAGLALGALWRALFIVIGVATIPWIGRAAVGRDQPPPPAPPHTQGESVATAARVATVGRPGQPVNLAQNHVPGKITIFDFYSHYCPPCMRIKPALEDLAYRRPDLVVREIDVNRPDVRGIDFNSPVVRQYQIRMLPHFVILDAGGRQIAQGDDAYDLVIQWLQPTD